MDTAVRTERILVGVSPAPSSARLVRAAHDLAGGLGAPWIAAHVALPAGLSDEDRNRVEAHFSLAHSLGGEVVRLTGRRTGTALVEHAQQRAVTRIVVGKPTHPRWRDALFGSALDDLIRGSGDVDVHVVTGIDGEEHDHASPAPPRTRRWPRDVLVAAALVGAATVVGSVARALLSEADVVMGFLLAILLAAWRTERVGSLAAALMAVAAFDFFFVPPYFTFAVAEQRYVLTFAALFAVGVAAGAVTHRLRRHEEMALAREHRTATLLSLTRAIAATSDESAIASVSVEEASARIAKGARLLLRGAGGTREVARAGEGSSPSGEQVVPLGEANSALGALVLVGPRPGMADLADAYGRQIALALERVRNGAAAEAARLRARTEELRGALLSAVSHDLRTPLATITGSATTLLEGGQRFGVEEQRELLGAIRDEAARLERLIRNLLEMTRISSEPVALRREWVPVEEIAGSAFARLDGTLGANPTTIDIPSDLPFVEADPILLEQVFVNLLENAARHTPPATPVRVSARQVEGGVEVEVADRGPGLHDGDEERVFEPFVRGTGAREPGSGLGLAICRGIVRAHGGSIRAERAHGGGTAVVFFLPVVGTPPAMPPEVTEVP